MLKKIIKYGASWCAPCRNFKDTFEKVQNIDEYKDITFESVDIEDDGRDIEVEKYSIRSVPTVVMLDENDNLLYKVSGNIPLAQLITLIENCSKK